MLLLLFSQTKKKNATRCHALTLAVFAAQGFPAAWICFNTCALPLVQRGHVQPGDNTFVEHETLAPLTPRVAHLPSSKESGGSKAGEIHLGCFLAQTTSKLCPASNPLQFIAVRSFCDKAGLHVSAANLCPALCRVPPVFAVNRHEFPWAIHWRPYTHGCDVLTISGLYAEIRYALSRSEVTRLSHYVRSLSDAQQRPSPTGRSSHHAAPKQSRRAHVQAKNFFARPTRQAQA